MSFKHLTSYLMVGLLLLVGSYASAQSAVSVKATIDSTQMWIGSQTALTFEVVQPQRQRVQLPISSDTIVGNLEIVQQARIDTLPISDDRIQVNLSYTVTSFEDSLVYIRPFPFLTGKDTVWSNSLSIRVIQPFEVDTATHALADIKPIYTPPFNWKRFLVRAVLVWLLIALLVLLFILIRQFVLNKPVVPPKKTKEVISPHEEAIRRLDRLRDEKSWQKGRVKEYHTELTDIIRIYIERMFNIGSMEMTSDEILEHVEFLKVDKSGAYAALRQILSLADLVKFAKCYPAVSDNELSLLNAYLFVNQTKIENVEPVLKN